MDSIGHRSDRWAMEGEERDWGHRWKEHRLPSTRAARHRRPLVAARASRRRAYSPAEYCAWGRPEALRRPRNAVASGRIARRHARREGMLGDKPGGPEGGRHASHTCRGCGTDRFFPFVTAAPLFRLALLRRLSPLCRRRCRPQPACRSSSLKLTCSSSTSCVSSTPTLMESARSWCVAAVKLVPLRSPDPISSPPRSTP